MNLINFIFSKAFWKQFLIIFVLFIVILYGVVLSLKFYTNHGETVAIPDLSGLTIGEALQNSAAEKLRCVVYDSQYVADVIPGVVVGQHPVAGYRAKQGRMIFLTIASVSPEKVTVPCIADVSLREASSRLQNAGVKIGTIEYRPSEFPNLVLDQLFLGGKIERDTMLPKGSVIDLIVGRSSNMERAVIPDLFGMSIAEAKRAIYLRSLDLGVMVYDDSFIGDEDTTGARIYKQSPLPNGDVEVEQGTMIDIWVSKYEELFTIDSTAMMQNVDSLSEEDIVLE